MGRSQYSINREKKRNSPETEEFRNEIKSFFEKTGVDPAIRYKIMVDLSVMTDMPFYRTDKGKRYKVEPEKVIKDCCSYLIGLNNIDFAKKLLYWMTRQQNQSLRKISTKTCQQKRRK